MNREDVTAYRCPRSGARLELRTSDVGPQVQEGELVGGGAAYPIVSGIPRFTPQDNYAANFGYQWNTFSTTQLDSKTSWAGRSERRLFEETRWPRKMPGQRILEAGSGMGRFTEHLASTDAEIFTFDYSSAVDANNENNGRFPNVRFAQADIYAPPFEPGSFDKVLCLGVIQHCPDPKRAFESLVRFLKPGGEIVIDVYRLTWKSFVSGKYYLRPLTSRLPVPLQHAFVKAHMAWAYPLTDVVHQTLGKRPGYWVSAVLSLADYRGAEGMDDKVARQMCELDTLDMLAPRYDFPKTVSTVKSWLDSAGLESVEVGPGYNGIEARGRRRLAAR